MEPQSFLRQQNIIEYDQEYSDWGCQAKIGCKSQINCTTTKSAAYMSKIALNYPKKGV